jgi:hypothetical protein
MNRPALLVAASALGPAVALALMGPIPQAPGYLDFADTRSVLGIERCGDVASNAGLLWVGILGLRLRDVSVAWRCFFAGVVAVAFGSTYFHLAPDLDRLVWDRAPMTVVFVSAVAAVAGDQIAPTAARWILGPGLLVGVGSVLFWRWTGDLRPYAWVQVTPMLTVPAIVLGFRRRGLRRRYLLYAVGTYAVAKLAEVNDELLLTWSGIASGHTLKHGLAALALWWVYRMLALARGEPSAEGRSLSAP